MNRRIVIADDSRVIRTVLARELVSAGWEVAEAADGAQAVELCRQQPPAAVLLDIEMPRLNGYQALAALRREPALADIPVIFLTSRDSSTDVAEGLRRGAHDYLRKPFEPMELIARLDLAQRTKALQDELRARNEELQRLAATDALTGLHNRRFVGEQLEAAVSRARRHGGELSVLLLDVDHFKQVNDTFGHAAGDRALREVSLLLRARLRREDVCGRWGGEEFLVLLPDTPAEDGALVAENIRALVAATPCLPDGRPVSVSIGVADGVDPSADALIQRADAALYAAKAAGRNTVRRATGAVAA